ncbi:hypothetical protein Dimus_008691 [Dionaea muscipula]
MTDARCRRCSERKVGLVDIIQAGHGDRYQLECVACGNTWYAKRDEAAMLTIEGPNSAKSVGTAPSATSKFENFEKKKLMTPREPEKVDALKKSTEAKMPALETQIEGPNSAKSVGTAPSATSKFENFEKKKLMTPREPEKVDALKKSTEAKMPALETQIEGPNSAKSVGTAPSATSKFENFEKKKLMSPRERELEPEKVDTLKKSTEAKMPVLETQIEGPNSAKSVGTAPSATSKFENFEKKKPMSLRELEKADTLKKSTEAKMPILETQKSSNKLKVDGELIRP